MDLHGVFWEMGMFLLQAAALAATTPPTTNADAIERLGVAGILVFAAYFLIRYFMGLLEKKEARLTDVTDRFLKATEEYHQVTSTLAEEFREFRSTHREMASALAELKGALRREPRE
jgi:hypothetical protein